MTQLEKLEESIKFKLEIKELKEKELQQQKLINEEMKLTITKNMKEKRNKILNDMASEVRKLKDVKKNNEELVKYIKAEEKNTNKNKYEFIKNLQILSDEKKRAQQVLTII